MFRELIEYFFAAKQSRAYEPVKHSFFKDATIAEILNEKGYFIVDFLQEKELLLLTQSYEKYHNIKPSGSGAFFGEISKEIHDTNTNILSETLDKWFYNYKSIVSAFVVKTPGMSSAVPIHQDSAAIDEEKYSSINLWMPLQDINEKNGVMCVVPSSHHIFFPYRCATVEPFSKNIETVLRPYFIPLYIKAGQALIFDSRMFHYSRPNLTDQNRVIAICRICPKEAAIIAYFKDVEKNDDKIEIWQCPDDYLIHSESHNDTIRPRKSKLLGYKTVNSTPLTIDEFEQIRKKLQMEPLY